MVCRGTTFNQACQPVRMVPTSIFLQYSEHTLSAIEFDMCNRNRSISTRVLKNVSMLQANELSKDIYGITVSRYFTTANLQSTETDAQW